MLPHMLLAILLPDEISILLYKDRIPGIEGNRETCHESPLPLKMFHKAPVAPPKAVMSRDNMKGNPM
jgi:hypothetical protein